MKRTQSQKIAIGGLFSALSIVLMLLGAIIPAATFAAPALAGILIIPAVLELGVQTGVMLYITVGLLSFFIVPDKEMSLIFIFFLGFYPMAKAYIERLRHQFTQWISKLLLFNTCVITMYLLILVVFPIAAIVAEFEDSGTIFTAILLLFANVTFVIYDLAIAKIIGLYCARLRPKLLRMH